MSIKPSQEDWSGKPSLALLADKEEDRFTVLLAELLRSRLVLEAFLGLCEIDPQESVSALAVRNQVTVTDGRPDLVIYAPRTYLLFEAKVGSWLHEGQAEAYIDALMAWSRTTPGGLARLTLIAPQHACERLRAEANAYAAQVGAPAVHHVSWEAIAGRFATVALDGAAPPLKAHLEMFADVVSVRLGQPKRPFTAEEVGLLGDVQVALAYHRVWRACVELIARLKSSKELELKITASSSAQWQGYTLRSNGRWWWLGLWPEVWAQIGITPFVLQIPGLDGYPPRRVSPDVPETVVYRYSGRSRMVIPMELVASESPEAMSDRHFKIVRTAIVGCPETGGTGSGPNENGPSDEP